MFVGNGLKEEKNGRKSAETETIALFRTISETYIFDSVSVCDGRCVSYEVMRARNMSGYVSVSLG